MKWKRSKKATTEAKAKHRSHEVKQDVENKIPSGPCDINKDRVQPDNNEIAGDKMETDKNSNQSMVVCGENTECDLNTMLDHDHEDTQIVVDEPTDLSKTSYLSETGHQQLLLSNCGRVWRH